VNEDGFDEGQCDAFGFGEVGRILPGRHRGDAFARRAEPDGQPVERLVADLVRFGERVENRLAAEIEAFPDEAVADSAAQRFTHVVTCHARLFRL
jgi:hypothetical protein